MILASIAFSLLISIKGMEQVTDIDTPSYLDNLLPEMFDHLTSFLPLHSLVGLRPVSRSLNKVTSDLVQAKFFNYGPNSGLSLQALYDEWKDWEDKEKIKNLIIRKFGSKADPEYFSFPRKFRCTGQDATMMLFGLKSEAPVFMIGQFEKIVRLLLKTKPFRGEELVLKMFQLRPRGLSESLLSRCIIKCSDSKILTLIYEISKSEKNKVTDVAFKLATRKTGDAEIDYLKSLDGQIVPSLISTVLCQPRNHDLLMQIRNVCPDIELKVVWKHFYGVMDKNVIRALLSRRQAIEFDSRMADESEQIDVVPNNVTSAVIFSHLIEGDNNKLFAYSSYIFENMFVLVPCIVSFSVPLDFFRQLISPPEPLDEHDLHNLIVLLMNLNHPINYVLAAEDEQSKYMEYEL